MLRPSPDPFYYLANFQQALAWLDARCADLFDAAERRFVDGFALAPRASQALFTRMLMRKGPHFRVSRLQYDEIGCPRSAAAPLVAAGWLDDAPLLSLDALAPLVTKAELFELAVRLGVDAARANPRTTRTQLLDALAGFDAADLAPRAWHAWFPDSADAVFDLTAAPLCERLRLMFFGNLHQAWSEFVLAELGVFRYERVPFDLASRAFTQRGDVDTYLALRDCRDALDAASSAPDPASRAAALGAVLDTLARVAPRTHANAWLRARHDKLRHALGLHAERARDPALAWRAYEDCLHPEARYRCIRVLEQLGRRDDALALAEQIVAAPANEEEAQRATRTLGRLRRSRGSGGGRRAREAADVEIAATANESFEVREIVLPLPAPAVRVEEAACASLHAPQSPAFHVENTLINALFGLLCWPALFAPLPGAFFHPFQRGPADLHAPDFVARRAALFAACLAELDSGAYRDTIARRYREKAGIQSPFVAWGALTPALLDLALDCLPATHLRLWFARLLDDPKTNRSGLPDLVRFWPRERRYELIEVKGPGDRLQDNQRRWLAYCVAHRMPVSVLQVRWADASEAAPAETSR
ncbi:MAG TPA: VRR-NUC domain-containing protein [Paraburkholderia sp.]|nr:VRR-NUC domain-containing protein [Paraburkholderia sp.]